MEIKESTGRAGCRKCDRRIEKGVFQVGELAGDDYGGTTMYWYHARCYIKLLEERVEWAIKDLESAKREIYRQYAKLGKTPWSK